MKLIKQNMRKLISTLIIVVFTILFCSMNSVLIVNGAIICVSFLSLLFLIFDRNVSIITLYINFISSYVLFSYLLLGNAPVWLVMLPVLVINIYLFSYLPNLQEAEMEIRNIYLIVYSLVVVEIFLFMGYFVLSPINRSLVLTLCLYLIYGYNDRVIRENDRQGFYRYIMVFFLIFVTIVLSASWGNI